MKSWDIQINILDKLTKTCGHDVKNENDHFLKT